MAQKFSHPLNTNFTLQLHFYLTGRICGTRCLNKGSDVCVCGGIKFTPKEYHYCCSQSACKEEDDRSIVCPNGKMLKFHEKCGNQCPIAELSKITIIKQCSNEELCPSGKEFSLICNGKNTPPKYGGVNCPKKAFSKFDFSQYYQ